MHDEWFLISSSFKVYNPKISLCISLKLSTGFFLFLDNKEVSLNPEIFKLNLLIPKKSCIITYNHFANILKSVHCIDFIFELEKHWYSINLLTKFQQNLVCNVVCICLYHTLLQLHIPMVESIHEKLF